MEQTIEIVSVSGGKFHRPDNTLFNGGNVFRDERLMRCGRSLVPSNCFETIADADKYTGGRLGRYICQHCEKKVTHMWRVSEILRPRPLEGAVLVDLETLADGSAPIRLSRSIRVF